jgi:hypothetical protein
MGLGDSAVLWQIKCTVTVILDEQGGHYPLGGTATRGMLAKIADELPCRLPFSP